MSKNSSTQTQNSKSTATQTPNNLPFLQSGWNAALAALNGTQSGTPNVNSGLDLTNTGANAGTNAAVSALNTAGGIANGGAVNGANQYITPIANGSQVGNNNPFFTQLISQLTAQLQPQVDGSFAANGRYGSGADANAFESAKTNAITQIAAANYQQSLQQQQQAQAQLSANNTNSNNTAVNALSTVAPNAGAAVGSGAADIAAGNAPLSSFANILQMLGAGGGTASGTENGTTKTSSSSFNPISLFSALFPGGA